MLPRVLPFALLGLIPLACQHPGVDENAFRWTNQLPPGAVVHIRNGAGNIIVKRSSGPEVVVSGTRQWRRSRESDIRFVVNQVGNDYYVCAMWHSSGKCGPSGYRGRRVSAFLTMFS